MHGCVRAAAPPHLVAIRTCASRTAAKQHKCLAQMERGEEGRQKRELNRRKMAASRGQTAEETQHKAGGDDGGREERISIGGVGGK